MSDVTRILSRISQGSPAETDNLINLVYDDLRRLARHRLSQEKPGQTLQATALVHEAFVRLVDQDFAREWENDRHFFAAAAEAMRRILLDRARAKKAIKRGGDRDRVELAANEPVALPLECDDLVGLDEVLQRLEKKHARKAEVVKLRFFAGLTNEQTGKALGISSSSAEKDWAFARAWLRVEMDSASGS